MCSTRTLLALGLVLLSTSVTALSPFSSVCTDDGKKKPNQTKVIALVNALVSSPVLSAKNHKFYGDCSCAGVATLQAPHELAGEFEGRATLILSTGTGRMAVREKNNGEVSTIFGSKSTPDAQVDSIISEMEYYDDDSEYLRAYDLCAIEFEVTLKSTFPRELHLNMPYVFASEEYPSDVSESKSDVFGFFFGNNSQNVAVIADMYGDHTPVNVDTINMDHLPDLFVSNFKMEEYDRSATAQSGDLKIEYDGFSTLLSTNGFMLPPGVPVKVKLAIADVGDNRKDSTVYISTPVQLCGDGIVQGVEECDDGNFEEYDGCNNFCKKTGCPPPPYVCGDPHIVSFDGDNFTFNGWAGASFNMLTHASYQVNAFFRKYPMQDTTKTWIGAIAMRAGQDDLIEVTGVGKGKLLVEFNGVAMNPGTKSSTSVMAVDYVIDPVDLDKEVHITTADITLVITMDHWNWNLDFGIEKISMDLGEVHGVIGQSYSRMVSKKMIFLSGTAVPPLGVVGKDADYNVKPDILGNAFKYNLFTGKDVTKGKVQTTSGLRRALMSAIVSTKAGSSMY